MTETMTYAGGCHCGAVRFEVDAAVERAVSCNCSICHKRGLLLAFADADAFRLQQGEDALASYRFNTGRIDHLHCRTCGVESFARSKRPSDGAPVVALNLRCLDGFDIEAVPIRKFDGASL